MYASESNSQDAMCASRSNWRGAILAPPMEWIEERCPMTNRGKPALNSMNIPASAPLATNHSPLATAFLIPLPGLEIVLTH